MDVCFVVFLVCLYICVCECLLTSTIQPTYMCPRSIAGVPSSQALPGFLSTAPPPVLVPAVLGALAVWIQNKKKQKNVNPLLPLSSSQLIMLRKKR